ncbi:helix-turn-helix transcriptional regulator [Mangrovihabitans endophyticus]|uniref:helix-turn-helix transcriptional regulator n=1 Tax=Mangrovihabitans endophyticus TaxID=1751298 RepID=UPI001665D3ED|nr:DNA-binding protein [Mangrovihabitans endophyticus]
MDSGRNAGKPLRLVGFKEICDMFPDISRQRVQQLTAKPTFPAPLAELIQGRVWHAPDIETWIRDHRPARACGGPDA